jgi:hypothetical protein
MKSSVLLCILLFSFVNAEFEAKGDIRIDDEPIESRFYKDNIDRFAPFPIIGLQARFAVTERWYVGASASIIGGEYQGMSAFAFESKMLARFVISKNFSILGELMFFNADTQIDEEKQMLAMISQPFFLV